MYIMELSNNYRICDFLTQFVTICKTICKNSFWLFVIYNL